MENTNEEKPSIMDDERFVQFMESRDDKLVEFITDQLGGIKEEIGGIHEKIGGLKQDVSELKHDVSELKQDVGELKQDMRNVKTTMITKSYLDDKIADLRVENNEKVYETANILKEKKVFDDKDIMRVKKAGVVVVK